MNLTAEGIKERDEIVFQEALRRKIPIVMVLSGGYARGTAQVIGDSIHNLVSKFDLLRRCEQKSNFIPRSQPLFNEESSASEEQRSSLDDEQVIELEHEQHYSNNNSPSDQYDSKEFKMKEKLSVSRDSGEIKRNNNNNMNRSNDSVSHEEDERV
jgi:hypothetical protein